MDATAANSGRPRAAEVWQGIANRMLVEFRSIQAQIPGPGERGAQRERTLSAFLSRYLPQKYAVGTGHITNREGKLSRQCDIVIYDAMNCPLLLAEDDYQLFPVEAVLGVIEVKSILDSGGITECARNIESVKSLRGGERIAGCAFAYSTSYQSRPSIVQVAEALRHANNQVPMAHRIDLLAVLDDGIMWLDPGGGEGHNYVTGESYTTPPSMLVFVELIYPLLALFFYRLLLLLDEGQSSVPDMAAYTGGPELGLVMQFAQSATEEAVEGMATKGRTGAELLHASVLRRHFAVNDHLKGWVSFETMDGTYLPGFGTRRIAKLVDGRRLLFTIGATEKGKRNGLSAAIEQSIQQLGLDVVVEPSTNGAQRDTRLYSGIDLADCAPDALERLLIAVEEAISRCS